MSSALKENEEDLIQNDSFRRTSKSYAAEVSEIILADGSFPWKSRKDAEELRQDIARMSEKKARELFESEEDRKCWIESIRKSVELNLQTQVRAALGTPPDEKRKRQQKLAEERQRNPEYQYLGDESDKNNRNFSSFEDDNDYFVYRRQQYLREHDSRSMRPYSNFSNRNSTSANKASMNSPYPGNSNLDAFSSDFNKHFSPYTRAALENVGSGSSGLLKVAETFKRSQGTKWIDSQGNEHDVPGPFWPKDHFPLCAVQTHINFVPEFIEPLNSTVGHCNTFQDKGETALYPRSWRGSLVVYDRHVVQPCPVAPLGCPPHLKFESRFECGNLWQAKRIGRYEYNLVLSNDLYTKRHTQWYYFRVENMIPGATYKFNIINLLKRESLYNYGMKPLLYSKKTAEECKIGWRRTGHNINYAKNPTSKNPLLCKELVYYALSFQVEFVHADDTCYLAHCYPYSYTELELYLRSLVDSPVTSQHVRKEVLCKTRAGNNCHVLTITSARVPDCDKLGVVISARVHPGETNASWMMKGLMDYLTSNDAVAESLRRKFVFKIVPMLNPDGVIVGNYRTNLAAKDLNRTYKDPKKDSFPTVWHTKNMLESFKQNHEVIIYCDLHGHSRKPNVFMYGCTADPKMDSIPNFLEERLFPWMMSKRAPDKFSFQGCKFMVRKCKESTARVVMWRQLGIMNSFTMEATFCGTNFGDIERGRHFNTHDFEDMGRHFCEVLMEYSEAKSANRNEMTQAFVELACKMTRDILRQTLGNFKKISASENSSTSSTPSADKTARKDENGVELSFHSVSSNDKSDDKLALKIAPRSKIVNYVDLDVRRARGDGKDREYEVSVKSVHVDSFNDCIKILEGLNLNDCYEESDSSDSDSDPDDSPEEYNNDNKAAKENGGNRRKKKKKKKKQNWWDTLSKSVQESNKTPEEESNKADLGKKVKTTFGKFVNPYANRFNYGIPVYSQERIRERAKKKEQEKEAEEKAKMELEEKYSTDDPSNEAPMIAFTNDTELNFVTAQRRLTYYMMNRKTHSKTNGVVNATPNRNLTVLPSQRGDLQVDSVKVEHLPGGGYGFAMRFPTRAHASYDIHAKDAGSGRDSSRQPSLQTFEEARSIGNGTPAFVEVSADEMVSRTSSSESHFSPSVNHSGYDHQGDQRGYHGYVRNLRGDAKTDLETMFRVVSNPRTSLFENSDFAKRDRTSSEFGSSNTESERRHLTRAYSEKVIQNYRTSGKDLCTLEKRAHERSLEIPSPALRSSGRKTPRVRVLESTFGIAGQDRGPPEFLPSDVIPSYSSMALRHSESSPNTIRRLSNK